MTRAHAIRAAVAENGAVLGVALAAVAYVVVLSSESVAGHRSFVTGFDTALYDQLVWLLSSGHEPFSTVVSKPMLADHFQPGLALFTPVYWLGGGAAALLVLQTVALAAAGPALYVLARASGARPALAVVPALLWLACPFLARLNLGEFRPTAVVPLLLVLSVLGAVQGRTWLLWMTTLLALSMKEDAAPVYVVLGALLIVQGKRRLGGALVAVSGAWLIVGWLVMRRGAGSLEAFGRRFAGDRGDSMPEALLWMAQHPLATAEHVASESLPYLVLLVVATGGLCLLAPLWMLLALPTAAHNALSAYEPQHLLSYHYHQLTMISLFVAAAIGVARLQHARREVRVAAGVGVTLGAALALGAANWAHAHWTEGVRLDREPTRAALAVIPPEVPVAASTHLLPHLSQRVEIYTLPEPFIRLDTGSPLTDLEFAERARRVEYVAYRDGDLPFEYTGTPEAVLERLARTGFVEVAREGPVTIFRRSVK